MDRNQISILTHVKNEKEINSNNNTHPHTKVLKMYCAEQEIYIQLMCILSC